MRSPTMRGTLVPITLLALAVGGAAACSTKTAKGGGGDASHATVAFLMPDEASTRYEQHDRPGFVNEMKQLCSGCKVLYQNADADASKQQQQFNSVISQGAKVIVMDPVDSTAAASLVKQAQSQGVKVIAYDRPIPSAKADYYVSFDNEEIGKSIAKSLVDHLKAENIAPGSGGLLEVNGSPTDAAAGLIKKGIHEGLAGSGYQTLSEYDTPDWDPSKAQQWVGGQISRFGKKIVGVVAANDGTGGGTIAAFKAAGVNPVPSVTGNDATIAGAATHHRGRSVQHDLQAERDRRRGGRQGRGRPAEKPDAQGGHHAVRHADPAVHPDGRHHVQPQGRDHRQGRRRQAHPDARATVHGPLPVRLRQARHLLSGRPFTAARQHESTKARTLR